MAEIETFREVDVTACTRNGLRQVADVRILREIYKT